MGGERNLEDVGVERSTRERKRKEEKERKKIGKDGKKKNAHGNF